MRLFSGGVFPGLIALAPVLRFQALPWGSASVAIALVDYGGPHPYELIPLDIVGYVVGAYLLVAHGFMLARPEFCKDWLVKLPRHYNAGVYTLGFGMVWFWLLVAPENMTGPSRRCKSKT